MAKLVLFGFLTIICMVTSDRQDFSGPFPGNFPHLRPPNTPTYLAYIVKENSNDNYPCLGVVLDSEHVLTTTACLRRKSNPIVEFKYPRYQKKHVKIIDIKLVVDHLSKNDEKYPNNLAIIRLQGKLELGDKIQKVELPSQKVVAGDTAHVSGLVGVCVMTTPRIMSYPLYVIEPKNCRGVRSDEFCVKRQPGLDSINYGAPVVSEDGEILGFTVFGCNGARFAVTEVAPHVNSIRAILKK